MKAPSPTSDEGFSLIEVLISVVIAAIAFAALLGGLGTTVVASDVHRQQADVNSVLVSAAESLDDPARNPFQPCADDASYNPTNGVTMPALAGGGLWPTSAVRIVSVENGNWSGSGFVSIGCTPAKPAPLQRIRVEVAAPAAAGATSRASDSLVLIKRRIS